jgi:hypothetical protein
MLQLSHFNSQAGDQTKNHALAWACIYSLRYEVLVIAVPSFSIVALSLSQTFLIQAAVEYVQDFNAGDSKGYGLIGAFGLVYLGIAVCIRVSLGLLRD